MPIRSDLSDAASRVTWALNNPAAARRIGEAGAELVSTVVTTQNALCYAGQLLAAYAAAQRGPGLPPTRPHADAVELTRSLFYPPR